MLRALLAVIVAAILAGCASTPDPLTAPRLTLAPYNTAANEVLWAVAPLRNESGTTLADPLQISDKLVAAFQEVRGVRCLPMNRVLEAQRALTMPAVKTPADAKALAAALAVDAIIVGSITAYEPYAPTLGLSLALIPRTDALNAPNAQPQVPVNQLSSQPTDHTLTGFSAAGQPISVISEHLDGKNHQVQMDVRAFAEGRADRLSALSWRRYLKSMPLFEEFAAHFAAERLIQQEWIRTAKAASASANDRR